MNILEKIACTALAICAACAALPICAACATLSPTALAVVAGAACVVGVIQ